MELHKRRKAVTEPEARYFMKQIALGVKYLHDNKIIHRDLKLGNLFLSDEMDVSLGGRRSWVWLLFFPLIAKKVKIGTSDSFVEYYNLNTGKTRSLSLAINRILCQAGMRLRVQQTDRQQL